MRSCLLFLPFAFCLLPFDFPLIHLPARNALDHQNLNLSGRKRRRAAALHNDSLQPTTKECVGHLSDTCGKLVCCIGVNSDQPVASLKDPLIDRLCRINAVSHT